jgi:hypothetical protein
VKRRPEHEVRKKILESERPGRFVQIDEHGDTSDMWRLKKLRLPAAIVILAVVALAAYLLRGDFADST